MELWVLAGFAILAGAAGAWFVRRSRTQPAGSGPAEVVEHGWQLYPKPTSGQPPGTVFRVDADGRRFSVGRPEVKTAVEREAFGQHREHVKAEAATLAQLFGIASFGARSSAIETLTVELDGVEKESLSDTDWDHVRDDFLNNVQLRADSTYYVIREARRARRVSYKLDRKTVDDLGGEARVSEGAKASGKVFVGGRDSTFSLEDEFKRPMRVMFLAERIDRPLVSPPSNDSSAPKPQLRRQPDTAPSEDDEKPPSLAAYGEWIRYADGPLGPVWAAVHKQTKQRSLIKRIDHRPPIDESLLERIAAAYGAVGSDAHAILPERIERAGSTAFEILPFVEGWSLTDAMSHDPENSVSGKLLEEWLLDLLKSLAVIHGEGIVHRDISPANILLRADVLGPAFVDFTSASLAGGRQVPLASPYVAPDAMSGVATPASDVYSLGAVLLFLLTHRDPPSPEQLARTQLSLLGVGERNALRKVLPLMLDPDPAARLPDAGRVFDFMLRNRHGTDLADYSVRSVLRLPDGRAIAMAKHTYRVIDPGESVPAELTPL